MSIFREINTNEEIYFHISYYNSLVKPWNTWQLFGKIFEDDIDHIISKNDMTILTFCNNNDFIFYFIHDANNLYEKYTVSNNVVKEIPFDLIKKIITGKGDIYIKFDNKKVTAKLKMMLG